MSKCIDTPIARLLGAVLVGTTAGLFIPQAGMGAVLVVGQVAGQLIFFLVPLIVLGFVGSSIGEASSSLRRACALAYASSVGAALLGIGVGKWLLPLFRLEAPTGELHMLPSAPFELRIAPPLGVMSALALALVLGLGARATASQGLSRGLAELRQVVLWAVRRVLVPVLPVYVGTHFCALSYEGHTARLWVFLPVLGIIVACHALWIALLYGLATLHTGQSSWQVLRHYGPAYLTALGTMSSAATLGVSLECAGRSAVLRKEAVHFAVPLLANIHLCGSVLSEVVVVCLVQQLTVGTLPALPSLLVFVLLLGVLAIGAPGVPGGTVMASLGLVTSLLGFDAQAVALLLALFALQDSFGTACNVVSDGALTLLLSNKRAA